MLTYIETLCTLNNNKFIKLNKTKFLIINKLIFPL